MPSPHFPKRLLLRQVRRTTRERKMSPEGEILTHKKRYTGHATVKGLSFDRHRAGLHPQHPPHLVHRHKVKRVSNGHHTKHGVHHTSAVHHEHRKKATVGSLHESRSQAAQRAVATKRAKGEAIGFAAMSPAQRHAAAEKRIATMKARHEPIGFARLSSAQRSAYAKRAAATRSARHESNFGHMSAQARHLRAVHASASRKAHGIKPFSHMSTASRKAAAAKSVVTKRARGERIGGWGHRK